MGKTIINIVEMTLKESLKIKFGAERPEWAEDELVEAMFIYQRYRGIVEEQAYVTRGSVLSCEFGTKPVYMDCIEDHGVYVGSDPLMTCGDCLPSNIHEFGSCMCPESNYAGRLPMLPGCWQDGTKAEKAWGNREAHICMPLINKEQGWQQIDKDVLIESHAHIKEPALLGNAVLVCNYGGIIRIREVPERVETPEEAQLVTMEQMDAFGFQITEERLEELNRLLEEFGITEKESIACFLATCAHESMNGTAIREFGSEEYFQEHGYSSETSGGGYMQLTGDTQVEFYAYLGIAEEDMPENVVEDIANNYAWLSAVWEWAEHKKGGGVIMNDYVNKNGGDEGIFLVTQYFINSYLDPEFYPDFNNDLSTIKEGNSYEYYWKEEWVDKKEGNRYVGTLHINGRVYRLPVGYYDRLQKYKLAMQIFCGKVIE